MSIVGALAGRRGDVALAGADAIVRAGHAHAQTVILAVRAARRRVTEDVLAVQLLGDPRRGLLDLRRVLHDLGPAAGLGRDLAQRRGVDPGVDRLTLRRVHGDGIDEGVAAAQ